MYQGICDAVVSPDLSRSFTYYFRLIPPPKVFPHDSSKSLVNYHLYITEFVPMSLPTSSLL